MADDTNIPAPPSGFAPVQNTAAPPPPPGFKSVSANPAAQPGAFQTKKGAPVQNVNTPAPPPSREEQVGDWQKVLHTAADVSPVGKTAAEVGIGAVKGLYQTGLGAAELLSKGANKIGIHTDETDALASGDVSPLSESMKTTEGAGQKVGAFGEELAEWMAGDEALKGTVKGLELVQKITKHAPQLIELAEKFPKATKLLMAAGKGAAVGGTQAAVKEGDVGAAKEGAEGGAVGATAGEVLPGAVKAVAKQFGVGTTDVEDVMKAAQPYKKNWKFIEDWAKAKDRIAEEVSETGKFKDLGEAADRIGDVRRKIWTDEVMPAVDRHANEIFDTTGVANAVRDKITPALQKNFPEDAKFLQEFADKYTSNTPLFTGDKTVAEAEKEIELYNAKLADEGYWKKTPKERAVMEKANPKIAAWRTASDEIRNGLYEHLEHPPGGGPGEPNIRELKDTYGAVGNIENEIRGQVNVAGRARPLSLKKIFGLTAGLAHGGPGGLAIAAAPIIDAFYNSPEALLNRAVSKTEPSATRKVASKVAEKVAPVVKAAAGVGGEEAWVSVTMSDGKQVEVHPDDLGELQKRDPGAKVNP